MGTFTCKTCGHETDRLEEFPGGICLGCYEISQIGAPMPTQQELLAMFTSPKIFRRTR
jgi:hypothetical protein